MRNETLAEKIGGLSTYAVCWAEVTDFPLPLWHMYTMYMHGHSLLWIIVRDGSWSPELGRIEINPAKKRNKCITPTDCILQPCLPRSTTSGQHLWSIASLSKAGKDNHIQNVLKKCWGAWQIGHTGPPKSHGHSSSSSSSNSNNSSSSRQREKVLSCLVGTSLFWN